MALSINTEDPNERQLREDFLVASGDLLQYVYVLHHYLYTLADIAEQDTTSPFSHPPTVYPSRPPSSPYTTTPPPSPHSPHTPLTYLQLEELKGWLEILRGLVKGQSTLSFHVLFHLFLCVSTSLAHHICMCFYHEYDVSLP